MAPWLEGCQDVIVKDERAPHLAGMSEGVVERRVIGEAQIAAQPH